MSEGAPPGLAARSDAVAAMVPAVSVVLPVRDGAATLERAIRSVLGQTLREWELLVIDDGSRDASSEIAAEAAMQDRRVRVVRTPALGLVAALNLGLAQVRAPLVARMDADDACHPDRFVRQVAALAADPSLGLVGCRVAFGGDPVAQEGYARHVHWLNELVEAREIALERFVESPFAHPSVMFRREVVLAHGGYAEGDFPEDYELWLRWLDAGVRMAKVPEVLLTWHDLPGRLSRTDVRYAPEAFYALKARYLARELARRVAPGREVWVWGAGRPTRRRARLLEAHGVSIAAYIDIDMRKVGRLLPGGRAVRGPEALPAAGAPGAPFVLGYVGSRGARELIRGGLVARGYTVGRDFFMAA